MPALLYGAPFGEAAQLYDEYVALMLAAREIGEEDDDSLLAKMDDLWWQMTPAERTAADERWKR